MVAAHMYASLEPSQRDLLHVYWYTGKDQATPLNANKKSRNCHIKLMSEMLNQVCANRQSSMARSQSKEMATKVSSNH